MYETYGLYDIWDRLVTNRRPKKKPMLELLSPAGSMDAVRAAVLYGANAVYLGYGKFHARQGAQAFSQKEMLDAIEFCHAHEVKVHVTLNTLAHEREIPAVLEDVKFLNASGVDALIVQDLGLVRRLRESAPDMALHASTQMTIHTVDGARLAKQIGFKRVVLARECSLDQIAYITHESGLETEVFAHGALCMCYSGQCYMSGMIGGRSGNRGRCAQPCRLPYRFTPDGPEQYPLSLKDLCLAGWLQKLEEIGVTSLKIEGRMKRPEYVAAVTSVYAALLKEKRAPTEEEMQLLERVFSRDGFTDGYLTGHLGQTMFGTRHEMPPDEAQAFYAQLRQRFPYDKERPMLPVDARFTCNREEGLRLELHEGHYAPGIAKDDRPIEVALHSPTTEEHIEQAIRKFGGTPYYLRSAKISLEPGLRIPAARINALRRKALTELQGYHLLTFPNEWREPLAMFRLPPPKDPFRGYVAVVQTEAQGQALLGCGLERIYAPLAVAVSNPHFTPILPRVFSDKEQPDITHMLQRCKDQGAASALISNVGHIHLLQRVGLELHGDFPLNVCNSSALDVLKDRGVVRQTLSVEAYLAQLRDIPKPIDTMLVVYGYLPLMIFENCAIRRGAGCPGPAASEVAGWQCQGPEGQALYDRRGMRFPLLPAYGCRNELLNSQPLCLSDRQEDAKSAGAHYWMLRFTVETPEQCRKVWEAFQQGTRLEGNITRGLYFRGTS